jgi:hypothetical protein
VLQKAVLLTLRHAAAVLQFASNTLTAGQHIGIVMMSNCCKKVASAKGHELSFFRNGHHGWRMPKAGLQGNVREALKPRTHGNHNTIMLVQFCS